MENSSGLDTAILFFKSWHAVISPVFDIVWSITIMAIKILGDDLFNSDTNWWTCLLLTAFLVALDV